MKRFFCILLIGALSLAGVMPATLAQEHHRLYTEINPADEGGIKGVIANPHKPILQILAIPPEEPRFVYKGKVTGNDKQGFLFESLPMAVYDLIVIYEDEFYEGFELHPKASTLTTEDVKKINHIITESQPFFTKKIIHRVEGTTGRGNVSRCVVTFLRDKASTGTSSHRAGLEYMVNQKGLGWRRTFKLIWLKDVGPGWQVVQARDLYPIWVKTGSPLPQHRYSEKLSRIRVTDSIKDLGTISMDAGKDSSVAKP